MSAYMFVIFIPNLDPPNIVKDLDNTNPIMQSTSLSCGIYPNVSIKD